MSAPSQIAVLRRLAIIALAEHGDAAVQAIGANLLTFVEADDAGSLDDALGLSVARGEPTWRAARARTERNRLLRLARLAFFADATPAEAAREIAAAWRRYDSTSWPRDRNAFDCPPRLRGTLQEALWRAARAWPGPPLSEKLLADLFRSPEESWPLGSCLFRQAPERTSS